MPLAVNSQILVILVAVATLSARVVSVQSAGPTAQTLASMTTTTTTMGHNGHCEKIMTSAKTSTGDSQYYYTRTRDHPSHLRMAEEIKNHFVDEIKYESKINGTKYEYYKSAGAMTFDELFFETIDKIFRHRLSAFYIHHYDRDDDKRRSSDPRLVSQEACARDLLYLIEKLPKRLLFKNPFATIDDHSQSAENDQDELLTPELTAFFDSYARQEAGLFRGNTYWVGSHDQCVTRHIFDLIETSQQQQDTAASPGQDNIRQPKQQAVSFKGRYCVASLKAPSWDQMIENKKRKARNYFKSERQLREYSRLFRLQLGICLPNSCDSTAMDRHLDEIRLLAKSTLEPRFANYELIDLFCLPDEASPLRRWSNSALAFIVVVSTWLVLILVATFADLLKLFPSSQTELEQRKTSQFARLMSLWSNYLKLMHVGTNTATYGEQASETEKPTRASKSNVSDNDNIEQGQDVKQPEQVAPASTEERPKQIQVDLRFLNALKALIMFWIINGHIMLLMIQTAKNILDSDALLNGLMHFLIGATFGVDLFFTMTGFLTAYLLFNSKHAFKMKLATWVYLSFHRYWRLAPMYLMTFWFSRSVMQSLGAGPLWDYGTSSLTFRGLCNNESWWYPLTLTSNLHGLFEECMITSWYISCDMQFWLISPVFIYLLARSPVQGWLVTIGTILASAKMRYESILADKSARYDELVQPRADIFMRVSHDLPALYTHPHYRISAYLVGLLAGHYVYMIKSNKWSSVLSADLTEQQQEQLAASSNQDDDDESHSHRAQLKGGRVDEKLNKVNKKTLTTTMTTTTKRENAPTTRLSRRTRSVLAYLGLFLFAVMASSSYLLANFFPSQLLKYSKPLAGVLHSLDHLVMSLGASLLIVTMCLGQWPRLTQFLSHPNWTRLSKINYALLLLQCEAIYYQIFRYEQVPIAGTRELINILFNLLVTLYPLAFVATLVFEFPLANLEKIAMSALSNVGKKKAIRGFGADDNDERRARSRTLDGGRQQEHAPSKFARAQK